MKGEKKSQHLKLNFQIIAKIIYPVDNFKDNLFKLCIRDEAKNEKLRMR